MRLTSARPMMVIAATLTSFLVTLPVILADLGPGPVFIYRLLIFPADLSLLVTALAVVLVAASGGIRRAPATVLLLLLTLDLLVAWVFHPSPLGALMIGRLLGASALAFAVANLHRSERALFVTTFACATALQVAFALTQTLTGRPIGLPSFGEVADPFLVYGGTPAPRGTMHSQYVLAGLCLVAALLLVREGSERRYSTLVSFVSGLLMIPVGITFSRAAALGTAGACLALAVAVASRRRMMLIAATCIGLGALIPGLIAIPGWTFKSTAGLSGREVLTEQSLTLIQESPLVGIGPGRTLFVLPERFPDRPAIAYQTAHDLPLLAAVEGGLPAGLLAIGYLLVLGVRSLRDVRALALFVAFVPYVLTDQFPYNFLQGMVLLGIWTGAIEGILADEGARVPLDTRIVAALRLPWSRRLVAAKPGGSAA